MLFELSYLQQKYNVTPSGVLHIGAHLGEERDAYADSGFKHVLWVEANSELSEKLEKFVLQDQRFQTEKVLNAAILDVSNQKVNFHIANNGQSSSLLEFGIHETSRPDIKFQQTIELYTQRIDELLKENPEISRHLTFANLDIQGVELQALKSFGQFLDQFYWIYTEVNKDQVYVGNSMIWDIDIFLLKQGFVRRETKFTEVGWGDAFYVREQITPTVKRLSLFVIYIKRFFGIYLNHSVLLRKLRKTIKAILLGR